MGRENEYDLEVALTKANKDIIKELKEAFPEHYTIEDRSENGWGLVIRSSLENKFQSLDDQVDSFLSGLLPASHFLEYTFPVLRIACFSNTVTKTINLGNFETLYSLQMKLEISVYPVE